VVLSYLILSKYKDKPSLGKAAVCSLNIINAPPTVPLMALRTVQRQKWWLHLQFYGREETPALTLITDLR